MTWDDMVYMQDMTHTACASQTTPDLNATTVPTKTLTDIRDGNPYLVAKLRDGNCWMTQNLDFDLDTSVELSPATSDVRDFWTPTASTQKSGPSFANDSAAVQSYDPGKKYCNTSGCNLNTSVNGGHDAVGNYYSWLAATAGSGTALESGNAMSSICPSGWQLPISGAYGSLFGSATAAQIAIAPFYFVYGGDVANSSLNNAGSVGYYWSSTAYSATNAYNLYFDSSNVRPSNNIGRFFGFSVRCVAR